SLRPAQHCGNVALSSSRHEMGLFRGRRVSCRVAGMVLSVQEVVASAAFGVFTPDTAWPGIAGKRKNPAATAAKNPATPRSNQYIATSPPAALATMRTALAFMAATARPTPRVT